MRLFIPQIIASCFISVLGVLSASGAEPGYVRFDTNQGSFDVQLLPGDAPHTVNNFLAYVSSGVYSDSFIDRSVPGFVIQGGGYNLANGIAPIQPQAPIVNEFKASNTRGTLALAKQGNNPDSGTSAFYFNEVDNSVNLDHQNGGFTVFGKVVNNFGLSILDAIAAEPIPQPDPVEDALGDPTDSNGNPLVSDTPLVDYNSSIGLQVSNLILISEIVPENAPSAPTISSVTPSAAKVGDKVVITGTGFVGPLGVSFGGVGVTEGSFKSTEITVLVPANAVTGRIIVNTANGGIYAPLPFTVVTAAPTVAKITLSGLTGTYTPGQQHPVTATTTPAGVPTTVLYNGSATPPTDPGTYTIVATATGTLSSVAYVGSATGKLVISPKAAIAAPTSIAGHTFTNKITTAGADFPVGASFDQIFGASADSGILPLSTNVSAIDGVGVLDASTAGVDVISFQTQGTVYVTNNYVYAYNFSTPTTGSFSITNDSSGTPVTDGAGTFSLAVGVPPPASVNSWSFQFTAKGGDQIATGNTSVAIAANGTFQTSGANGSLSGASTYSVPAGTQNGSTLVLTSSTNANDVRTFSLSWLTATSGLYLLENGGDGTYQLGTFTSVPAAVTPVTSMLTATGTVAQSFTYTFTDATPIGSYTATGLPPGLTLNAATGVISGYPAAAGTFNVAVTATNGTTTKATLVLTIAKATATVSSSVLTQPYTGKPVGATYVSNPPGLDVVYTYTQGGKVVTPVAIGSYGVTASISDDDYMGSATGTFTVSIGHAAFSLTNLSLKYTGKPQGPTVKTTPAGLPVIITFTGTNSTADPTAVGSYPFTVTLSSSETLYSGTTTGTFNITAQIINQNPSTSTTATGATLSESVNPGGLATTAYFKFGSSMSFGFQTPMQVLGSGTTAVQVNGLISGLLPNTTYYYQLVTVSVGGTINGPIESFTTPNFDTSIVAQSGDTDSAGDTFTALGTPARDGTSAANVAFGGSVTTAGAASTGVWLSAGSGAPDLIARTGLTAPGTGSTFLSVGDPIINDSGKVAFAGTFTGNVAGLWSTTAGSLALVAKAGDVAPNSGATFKSFGHLALRENTAGSGAPIFMATLNSGNGVTAANSTGIWSGVQDNALTQIFRQGQTVGNETVTQFNFLPVVPLVGGQTRSFVPGNGDLVFNATFADKSSGIVTILGGSPQVALQSGTTSTGISGLSFAAFGPPAINNGDHLAFAATLAGTGVTSATSSSIWADNSSGTHQLIARAGVTIAPDASGLPFATLSDPVYNNNEGVAFIGTLKGGTATSDTGVWCNSTGTLHIVAREGSVVGGASGGTFAGFTQIALPDQGGSTNHGGVIMLATLNPNSALGITTANNTGIWAVDTSGALQLIVRTGDLLPNRAGVFKTVASLAFLPNETVVNGQTRSFDPGSGDLVYLATFSDKTTGIYAVSFP